MIRGIELHWVKELHIHIVSPLPPPVRANGIIEKMSVVNTSGDSQESQHYHLLLECRQRLAILAAWLSHRGVDSILY